MTLRTLDRALGILLALGGVGHALGSWRAYHDQPMSLLWALSATLAIFLLAALNLLRASRSHDAALAWISFFGCLAWIGFVLWFGSLIGNLFDFRPLVNFLVSAALAAFSFRSAWRAAQPRPA